MARIRTIKPEFWEDEKISEIPMQARLLFIGLWNFSDDNGAISNSIKWIKAKIFPYDNLRDSDVKTWLDALVKNRMLIPFEYHKKGYYVIRRFQSHQMIDKRYMKELIPFESISEIIEKENTMLPQCEHDVSTPLDRKGSGKEVEVEGTREKSKVENSKQFSPPTLLEVITFFKEKNFSAALAEKAFNHYQIADWHDSKGNQVKNWKQKMQTNWMGKEEPRIQKNQQAAIIDNSKFKDYEQRTKTNQ